MTSNDTTWLLVACAHGARLIRAVRGDGRPQWEEVDEVREHWDEKEHHRPSPLGPNKASHSFTSPHHEEEERLRRFGHVLSDWVAKAIVDRHIRSLEVFSPPRLMGALRNSWRHDVRPIIHETEVDLASMPINEIARHPRVQSLLEEPACK